MRKRVFALLFSLLIISLTVFSSFAFSDVDLKFMPFQPTLTVGQLNVESSSTPLAVFSLPVVGEPLITGILSEFTFTYDAFLTSTGGVNPYSIFYNDLTFLSNYGVSSLVYTDKCFLLDSDHLSYSFSGTGNQSFSGVYEYSYRDVNSESTQFTFVYESFDTSEPVDPFANLFGNPNTYFLITDFRLSFTAPANRTNVFTGFTGPCLTFAEWSSLNYVFLDLLGAVSTGDYNDGYDDGYADGEIVGYNQGFETGYASGLADGGIGLDVAYQNGYTAGYDAGSADGYDDGVLAGYSSGYNKGYDDGSDAGFIDGHVVGYTEGFSEGYYEGYQEGLSDGGALDFDFTSWLADAVENFFNFHLTETITLGLVLACVISALLIIAILKHTS